MTSDVQIPPSSLLTLYFPHLYLTTKSAIHNVSVSSQDDIWCEGEMAMSRDYRRSGLHVEGRQGYDHGLCYTRYARPKLYL